MPPESEPTLPGYTLNDLAGSGWKAHDEAVTERDEARADAACWREIALALASGELSVACLEGVWAWFGKREIGSPLYRTPEEACLAWYQQRLTQQTKEPT